MSVFNTVKKIWNEEVSVSNTTSETDLLSHTVEANTLDGKTALRLSIYGRADSPMLTLPALTVKVYFGSNSVTLLNGVLVSTSLSDAPFALNAVFAQFDNNTNKVYCNAEIKQDASRFILTGTGRENIIEDSVLTADTTTDQIMKVTVQFSLLSASTQVKQQLSILEKLYS